MSNKCSSNVVISINNLNYPIKVLAKHDFNGVNTIVNINIESTTNTLNETEFQQKLIEIIEDNGQNSGLYQLSKNILDYFNSIRAINTKLSFEYPYFVNENISYKKSSISKTICRYIVQHDFKRKEKRWFEIEAELSLNNVSSNSKFFDVCPFILLVKYESEDLIFVEDVIKIINNASPFYVLNSSDKLNNNLSTNQINNKILLLEEIKKNIETNYDVSNCVIHVKNVNHIFSYSFGIT
jgi:hypothetical protein